MINYLLINSLSYATAVVLVVLLEATAVFVYNEWDF